MQKQLELTRSLNYDELRKLASTEGPCITVCMGLQPAPNQSRMDFQRLKSAIRQAETKLQEGWPGVPPDVGRELTESLHMLESDSDQWGGEGGSLVILRSPEVFRAFELHGDLQDSVVVGDFFHIFPLLPALQVAEEKFYILALSQKNVRLLACTADSSHQLDLPNGTPTNLEDWLNTRMPNASPDRTETHSGPGGCTAGSFTSTTDRDNKDEHLANFYRVINKAVTEQLRGQPHPLVLAGVEYERSMYRGINSYSHLCEEDVQGSPESLKGPELHQRALEAVQDFYAQPARKAMELWDKVGGGERALTKLDDIVKAAFEGRVAHLFATRDAQGQGVFDRNTMQVRSQGRQEDLVNAAALQTLAYGGDVFIVNPDQIPNGSQLAAITRF